MIEGFRLSPQQRRQWAFQREGSISQVQGALRIEGALAASELRRAVEDLVRAHEILRSTFHSLPGMEVPVQAVAETMPIAWRELHEDGQDADGLHVDGLGAAVGLNAADGTEANSAAADGADANGANADRADVAAGDRPWIRMWDEDGRCPFDPEAGPMLRASYLRLGPNHAVLTLTAPAVCVDSSSMILMLDAIAASVVEGRGGDAHAALSGATPHAVPEFASSREPSVQYVDFAEWQNDVLADTEAAARAHWRRWSDWRPEAFSVAGWSRSPVAREGRASGPGDAPFSPHSSLPHSSSTVRLRCDRAAVDRLDALASASGVPASSIVCAAWLACLCRLSGGSDLVLGCRADGRRLQGLDAAIGVFARYLPVSTPLSLNMPFVDLVRAIDRAIAEACANQEHFHRDYTANTTAAATDAATGHFPVLFDWDDLPPPRRASGLMVSIVDRRVRAERCDVRLSVLREPSDLVFDVECAEHTIGGGDEAFHDALMTVLQQAIASPERAIVDLDLLGEAVRQQVLVRWNACDSVPIALSEGGLPAWFEAQVRATPDATAVVCGEACVSYAALNRRANQLAHALRRAGAGLETPVVLESARTIAAHTGIWATLKAGGMLAPLDLMQPAARLRPQLDNCAGVDGRLIVLRTGSPSMDAVATSPAGMHALSVLPVLPVRPALPPLNPLPASSSAIIEIDARAPFAHAPADLADPARRIPASAGAYLIFTSGSTGTPKGTLVTHGAVQHLVDALTTTVYVDQPRWLRVSVNAPLTFDAAVKQWSRLLRGDTLVIVPEDVRADGAGLRDWLEIERVEVLDTTPAQVEVLLDAGPTFTGATANVTTGVMTGVSTGATPNATVSATASAAVRAARGEGALRLVLVGGEAIPAALWARLTNWTGVRVANVYGPTECTVDTTSAWVTGDTPGLGGPLPRVRVYVLDARMRPMPVGMPGELYIGGSGVARGYPGRPGLAASRFVPDPFAASVGARLYRTGDRVRWTTAGTLEFLGRSDRQVKIRGYRIELGEIEAALRAHPGVMEAAVVVLRDADREPRLAAYVTPRTRRGTRGAAQIEPQFEAQVEAQVEARVEAQVEAPRFQTQFQTQSNGQAHAKAKAKAKTLEIGEPTLRAHLRDHLPAYMLPATCTVLPALPLTRHGKVDRLALAALDPAVVAQPPAGGGSRTEIEEVLANIFSAVLGVDDVGREASFFDLGGHSLLATQVISRVRQAFRIDVPLRALFDAPTVARLAQRVKASFSGGAPAIAAPGTIARPAVIPLSLAQQRLWFLHRLAPEETGYNSPAVLRLRGHIATLALMAVLDEIVRRHEVLRSRFPEVDGTASQEVLPPDETLPVVDLSGLPRERQLAEARKLTDAEARRVFDLLTATPLRVRLLRFAKDEHQLLFTLHHIAGDAWSVGVLARELSTLYPAYASGQPSPLPELPVQYADYAIWQREWLSGTAFDEQLAYWRQQLAGATALPLPADAETIGRRRRRVDAAVEADWDSHAANAWLVIPASLSSSLRTVGRQQGATVFMTLLAAFEVLLARWTGARDLLVGTSSIVGRDRLEFEGQIGFFVNMLPLRVQLRDRESFAELLVQVREAALGAYAHAHLPFERVVQEVGLAGQDARTSIVQVVFGLAEVPQVAFDLPGIAIEQEPEPALDARFPLSIWVTQDGESLKTRWTFDPRHLRRETIERLQRQYTTLLTTIAAQPSVRVGEIDLRDSHALEEQLASRSRREAGNAERLRAAVRVARPQP